MEHLWIFLDSGSIILETKMDTKFLLKVYIIKLQDLSSDEA